MVLPRLGRSRVLPTILPPVGSWRSELNQSLLHWGKHPGLTQFLHLGFKSKKEYNKIGYFSFLMLSPF